MILAMLLMLLLAAGVLAWLRWHRSAGALLAIAAIVFVAAACGPLPRWLLGRLQRGFPTDYADWGGRNAIVLLGAGTVRADHGRIEPGLMAEPRLVRAAMLYRDCKAHGADCRIEASGGDATGLKITEAALYGRALQRLGVPAGDLLLEPHSRTTWQNAQFSAPLLRHFAPDRVLLVSSASHLRRARLYFRHFGIEADPVRADYLQAPLTWVPQAWDLALTDLALHEYVGIARYHVYQAMGWNTAAVPAGSAEVIPAGAGR